ncbi:MAG: ornithine carbamoyltransferase [Boseongicola sp. SB0676_bin_33]|nr:ornithine carbamoyltransferase [Boseongicola sp. SB0676_bin_33]MYK31286.1 ornithine carbamoyltransferase [Boseongicola sp. SB0670_bin_30]
MRHFLDIHNVNAGDLRGILDQAKSMKDARAGRPRGAEDDTRALAGRMVALLFEKPSTRTRVSFDVGTRQLGGRTLILSGSEIQLGHGETIADTARVLSRYVDLVMIRTFEEESLLELARHASAPVINGLTNRTHPCQVMADVMTFEEHRGQIAGRKVVWVGDGNNVCASFLHAAGQFGFELVVTGPEDLTPEAEFVELARAKGASVELNSDPVKAVSGADLVVTDTWISMHDSPAIKESRRRQLQPYQVNEELMAHAKSDALFMHCLPAHRGEEATDEVLDGPNSKIFDEAENRLHVQKAIMRWCLDL